jgi:hypothetical protein
MSPLAPLLDSPTREPLSACTSIENGVRLCSCLLGKIPVSSYVAAKGVGHPPDLGWMQFFVILDGFI